MNRTTFNISLPDTMGNYVRQRVKQRSYGSVSEYVRDLIRNDQKRAVGAGNLEADMSAVRREQLNSYRDPFTGKWRS